MIPEERIVYWYDEHQQYHQGRIRQVLHQGIFKEVSLEKWPGTEFILVQHSYTGLLELVPEYRLCNLPYRKD